MGISLDGISFSSASGKILKLPCKYIKGESSAHPAVISAIKAKLSKSKTNVTPVIVSCLDEDDYVAIANSAILQAARELEFLFVKGMIVDDDMLEQIEAENGSRVSISLQDASKEEIHDFFDYLKTYTPGFSRIQPDRISDLILSYREEHQIKNLNFITKLRCGIGKTKIPVLRELVTL